MIAIIDYGTGNLRSVQKAFEKVGADAPLTTEAELLEKADKIVLPGVSAFKDAMDGLVSLGLGHFTGQINVAPFGWLWLTVFVGANLTFAGLTGFCLMTKMLTIRSPSDLHPGPDIIEIGLKQKST
jgi:glutamine amidotransferase